MTALFKTIFMVITASLSFFSQAGWEKIDFSNTNVHHYIDKNKIDSDKKPYPGLWVLNDYPEDEKNQKYKSAVLYMEFDCKSRKVNVSMVYTYSQRMGMGKIVNTLDGGTDFKLPPPNSPPELYRVLLCGK